LISSTIIDTTSEGIDFNISASQTNASVRTDPDGPSMIFSIQHITTSPTERPSYADIQNSILINSTTTHHDLIGIFKSLEPELSPQLTNSSPYAPQPTSPVSDTVSELRGTYIYIHPAENVTITTNRPPYASSTGFYYANSTLSNINATRSSLGTALTGCLGTVTTGTLSLLPSVSRNLSYSSLDSATSTNATSTAPLNTIDTVNVLNEVRSSEAVINSKISVLWAGKPFISTVTVTLSASLSTTLSVNPTTIPDPSTSVVVTAADSPSLL
jgi:hypothetical protein